MTRQPPPAAVCPASIRGHCLAAALGGDVCAIQDGECVWDWPDPQPPGHDGGPTVAEAAADDRRWPLEKHGE